ncbi:tyrosine-type recombinase/integrase [Haloferax volcanii]|uniref:Integrase family protein n=3 Tax=Haloferax volcanii TaxID=2246 RepID=D4H005_HALVD|nr:site-specific integrase [Haloferax volcanii]ADE02488.1 integrase family protein [Haloferax volcanii DS2]ELY25055.1 putative phage integrase [Haloferax volcanii DS2]MBS8119036.1 site-specific integrase [Haloferax volcanii]MBS8124050.1 site-specific integrase [Haloferax volcanii]MBS8127919.1 site-specific integrase [Haloferax volcanii]
MKMQDYESKDGKKVWLSRSEVDTLLDVADGTEQRVAFALGARCGLRVAEVVEVTPDDVVDTEVGKFLRVWEGKGSKYRETPIPTDLAATIAAVGDYRDESSDTPVVDRTTRTVRNWVTKAGDQLVEETEDVGWSFLGPHDLRRTWGTLLVGAEVEPGLVMEWGGWEDWETFREHYLGAYSLEAQARGMGKIEWL